MFKREREAIDTSRYSLEERTTMAQALLDNLDSADDWKWELLRWVGKTSPNDERMDIPYVFGIKADSKKSKLTIAESLGEEPWHYPGPIRFRADRDEYILQTQELGIEPFQELRVRMFSKAKEIRDQQKKISQGVSQVEDKAYKRGLRNEAKGIIDSLTKRLNP